MTSLYTLQALPDVPNTTTSVIAPSSSVHPSLFYLLTCNVLYHKVRHGTASQPYMCHGTTSLPLLHPPLAASDPIYLHSTSSASTLLQLQCVLVQLFQLHHTHSWTNHRSILDPFGPGSHAKGCCLYTLSTFVLFA